MIWQCQCQSSRPGSVRAKDEEQDRDWVPLTVPRRTLNGEESSAAQGASARLDMDQMLHD